MIAVSCGLQRLGQLATQRSEGVVKIFVMNYDIRRNSKSRGREVPDCAHSSFDQHIGNSLRSFSGSGDDSDENLHTLSQFAKPLSRENRFPMYFAIEFVGV
jgi:hypothetical protein